MVQTNTKLIRQGGPGTPQYIFFGLISLDDCFSQSSIARSVAEVETEVEKTESDAENTTQVMKIKEETEDLYEKTREGNVSLFAVKP